MEKIVTKAKLKKFYKKLEELVETIDNLADECTIAFDDTPEGETPEGETEMAEALWSAQSYIKDAKLALKEYI